MSKFPTRNCNTLNTSIKPIPGSLSETGLAFNVNDSILNIYSDEIKVLYIGYQVIIKKTDFNFIPKIYIDLIISEFTKYPVY